MKKVSKSIKMELVHPYSAGIDVSKDEHVVAINPELSKAPIQSFGSFTTDLKALSSWLKSFGIQTVAMESTGIYWLTLYLHLQSEGFDVYLVNAKHVKNVKGKKTDELDAQWIQRLHSCGLLENSFQPDLEMRELRYYMRMRKDLLEVQKQHTSHMQKALEQMNLKLGTVLTDITGKSGKKIIQAIIDGERDAKALASLADRKVKASKEKIQLALQGQWHEMYLFELEQSYSFYCIYEEKRQQLDDKIQEWLIKAAPIEANQSSGSNCKKSKNGFHFDVASHLKSLLEIDILKVWGISEINAMEIISEIGIDMSKWPSAKHFSSWLGLAPNTKISGGKVLSSRLPKKKNRAGQSFRMAAYALQRSDHYLGDFYRRKRSKLGPKGAITATARKLATYVYKTLSEKIEFSAELLNELNQVNEQRKLKGLAKKANKLGFILQPVG